MMMMMMMIIYDGYELQTNNNNDDDDDDDFLSLDLFLLLDSCFWIELNTHKQTNKQTF